MTTIHLTVSPEDFKRLKIGVIDPAHIAYHDQVALVRIAKTQDITFTVSKNNVSDRKLTPAMWTYFQGKYFSNPENHLSTEKSFNKVRFKILFEQLEKLDKQSSFLDLGSQDNFVALKAKEMGFNDITIYDLPIVIDKIASPNDGIKYLNGDLNYYFPSRMYNFIHAGEVIEHLYNDWGFLDNCYKHTKSGGTLMITAPQDPPAKRWYEDGDHIRCYPDRTLEGLVACAGYTIKNFYVQLNKTKNGPRTLAIVIARKELQ